MPDTGEDREIKGRVNAKEAEIALETRKLVQRAGQKAQKAQTRSSASKKNRPSRGSPLIAPSGTRPEGSAK